jgi:hypothetical protein
MQAVAMLLLSPEAARQSGWIAPALLWRCIPLEAARATSPGPFHRSSVSSTRGAMPLVRLSSPRLSRHARPDAAAQRLRARACGLCFLPAFGLDCRPHDRSAMSTCLVQLPLQVRGRLRKTPPLACRTLATEANGSGPELYGDGMRRPLWAPFPRG